MVLDRFFGSNNEPPSKFRQLDKDVQKEQQQEQEELFDRMSSRDPFAAFFNGRDPFEDMMRQHPFGGMMRQSGLRVEEKRNGATTLSMDVPGVKAEDLSLQLMDDAMLCVTGKSRNADNNNRRSSMQSSQFRQCVSLGPVDPSSITADLSNGVLVVQAQKVAPQKKEPIQIPISEGNGRPKL